MQTVKTRTGKDTHYGTASKGQVQTQCGIGYGRFSRGMAVTGAVTCERCLKMRKDA